MVQFEHHARSLEECLALKNVFQFVCGLTDDGAVKVFKHFDSVRISDPSLILSTVPDVDVPLRDITKRHRKFNDFVLDCFQEVQSKAELSKNCFDCVGGIILVGETISDLPLVNDLRSWSIYFFVRNKAVSNLYEWLVLRNNGSSELHELRLFLESFLVVECNYTQNKSCTFNSCLCFRNDQVYIYITHLELSCSSHASLFTEAAKIAFPSDSLCSGLFNLAFLRFLKCRGSGREYFTKAAVTCIRICKYLRALRSLL